jgi:hypothetical protein
MSGGSYGYAQFKLEEIAEMLRGRHPSEELVLALADHVDALGKVMHDVEWADSGDSSWDDALDASIRNLISPAVVEAASRDAVASRTLTRYGGMLEDAEAQVVSLLDRIKEEQPDAMVTRFEVIDHRSADAGRAFVAHDVTVERSYQDGGATLKIFVNRREVAAR